MLRRKDPSRWTKVRQKYNKNKKSFKLQKILNKLKTTVMLFLRMAT